MSRREYRSTLREEQARRTRALVLDAAAACFLQKGYTATTMKDIATTAGVSPQTVFAQGSKASLLLASVDRALTGDDEEIPLLRRKWMEQLIAERDRAVKLRLMRDASEEWVPRAMPIVHVFRDAAAGDAEIAAAWADYEQRRWSDMRVVVGSFAHLLRDDLDVDRATDAFWSTFSPENAHQLIKVRGWSPREYADWTAAAVQHLFLRD